MVFTTSQSKVEDDKRLGADEAVLSSDAQQMATYAGKLNLILDTVSAKHDVNTYLNLLRVDGSVVLVGLPPEPLEIGAFNMVVADAAFRDLTLAASLKSGKCSISAPNTTLYAILN